MVARQLWIDRVEAAWEQKSVIWLSGVRRVGKTYLCQSLEDVEYFDCELPRVRQSMEDPEAFLGEHAGQRIVLDEVHRLPNASELLKIAADHYPGTRVIATGSSTLGASSRFRDTLTGRKENLWLTPMVSSDLKSFGIPDLDRRLLHGGLPPFFVPTEFPGRDIQEWLDSYWSKDILEMFRLERRWSFQRFLELLITQSGGLFEATKFAVPCEVSRQTISNYLTVLEATYVAHAVRPFSSRRSTEIVSAPKVYAFDTGFVSYFRGWDQLRDDDRGHLWEHYVLNEIQGCLQLRSLNYWRSKSGAEVDFVLQRRGSSGPVAIECKWSTDSADLGSLASFRHLYPKGDNYVVAADVGKPFTKSFGEHRATFVSLSGLIEALA